MKAFLKFLHRLTLEGNALSPRQRKELSEADVVRAFQDIEAGSPSVRAFLEVTLDLAAGYSESALAFGIPSEARIYYAGAAAGLRKLAEHVMQLHATKPPPLEEKANAGPARKG